VVVVSWYHTSATASVADTAGNTYTGKTVVQSPGNEQTRLFYAYNITGHASNVVTATFSATCPYRFLLIEQYSGILITDPFDVEANAHDESAGTTATSATFTTTQADELIVVGVVSPNCGAMTAGTGYTLLQQPSTLSAGDEEKIVSSIQTSVTATMTWATSSSRWSMVLATFKASAVGAMSGTSPSAVWNVAGITLSGGTTVTRAGRALLLGVGA